MLKKTALIGGTVTAMAFLATGCGSGSGSNGSGNASGGKPQVSATLNVGNFGAYLPPKILTEFDQKYHTHVNYSTYTTNPELLDKLQAGGQYDVAVASDWMVDTMIKLNLLEKIDYQYVPNIKNIDPNQRHLKFDSSGNYSVPYLWGATAIAVNTKVVKTPVKTWSDLLKPEFKDALVVPDDSRDMMTMALLMNGHDPNDTNANDIAQAQKTLDKFRPQIKVFDSDQPHVELLNGEAKAGIIWTGEGAQAYSQNPAIKPVFPNPIQKWVDNMVIPTSVDPSHKYTAELFINFLLDPKISAQLEDDQEYSDPNAAADQYIDPSYRKNPWVELPSRVAQSGEVELAIPGSVNTQFSNFWTQFKSFK